MAGVGGGGGGAVVICSPYRRYENIISDVAGPRSAIGRAPDS